MSLVDVSAPDDGVMIVTMADPHRYNAMSNTMISELLAAFAEVKTTRECRCAVLTGSGRGFCSGADLSFEPDPAPDSEGRTKLGVAYKAQQHLSDLIVAIRELPKPVVGAVHGAAVGGGLGIALSCDLRIGAPSAMFSARFIRIGLTALDMGVSYLLPQIVGAGRSAELLLTGRDFGSEEAERIGLLNRVVPEEDLLSEAVSVAKVIAGHAEFSTWMTKSGMWMNADAPSLRHAIELENRSQVLAIATGNLGEGARAMMQRRPAVWKPL